MYSAVHIYSNLPVAVKVSSDRSSIVTSYMIHGVYIVNHDGMLQVIQRRRVKSWDVLHGHSVPREFRLLHQLQGEAEEIVRDHKTVNSPIYSTLYSFIIYERQSNLLSMKDMFMLSE